jgi:protein ImuA
VDGAAAACFVAGIAARTPGKVLWCVAQQDLFAPGLEQAGLSPDRVIHVEAGDDKSVLACMEEGLRHGGLGAVVADIARLPMTASRRLHLAAKESGTIGIALRRWRRQAEASDFGQPSAAMTRWRVSVLPSRPLPVPGVGRARWLIELIRARAGESLNIELEACDGSGHLGLPADMADRPAAAEDWRHSAAG